jgi:hypothetical protein
MKTKLGWFLLLLLKIIDLWGKTINFKTSSREGKKRLIIHNISKGNK